MNPDGSKNPPPEEKLLKLIRGSKPVTPAQGGMAPPPGGGPAVGGPAKPWPTGSPIGGGVALPGGIRAPVFVAVDVSSWWMQAMQIMLGLLIAGELITLAVVLIRPPTEPGYPAAPDRPESHTPGRAGGVGDGSAERQRLRPPAAPSAEELTAPPPSLSASVARPLFLAPAGTASSGVDASRPGGAAPSEGAEALAARLSLTGIMGGSTPQAIIEDAQTKKTFVVTAGQSLINGLVVSEVRENGVVLDLHGEKIELSL